MVLGLSGCWGSIYIYMYGSLVLLKLNTMYKVIVA